MFSRAASFGLVPTALLGWMAAYTPPALAQPATEPAVSAEAAPSSTSAPAEAAPSSTSAPAPRAGGPSAEDKETARALYRLGHERRQANDFHGALKAFAAADKIMGVPTTGIELARAQAKLGLLLEARHRALAVTRYPQRADEPEPFARAREDAVALAQELERRIPSIRLELMGSDGPLAAQANVTVKLDGKLLGAEQRTVPSRVNPGPHVVVATAAGYAPFRGGVSLQEQERRVLQLTLVRAESVELGSGDEEQEGVPPAVYVGFAVGGAALVAGAITGALTLSEASDLDEACPNRRCPQSQSDALSSARTLSNVSTACFIGGSLGIAVGAAALLMSFGGEDEPAEGYAAASSGGERPPAPRPTVRPWIGLGQAGVFGRF